jgi:hypothetical protein
MRPREAGGGSAWPDARRPSGGGVSRSYAQPYGDSRESYLARVVEDKKVPSRTRLLAAAEVGSLAAWRTLRQYGIANRLELATTSWNSNAPQVRGIRRLRHRIRGRSVSARFSPVTDCPIRRAASSSVAAPVRRPNRCRRCFGRRISRASRRVSACARHGGVGSACWCYGGLFLLEAVFKVYVEDVGLTPPAKQTIGNLYKVVRDRLGLDPAHVAEQDLKRILSGLI